MKKVAIFSLALISVSILICCGPSKKEKGAALEKARQDSIIAVVEAERQADSIAATGQPQLADELKLSTNTPKDKKFIKTADVKFKVNNVWKITERIEDITARYGGFVTFSELKNRYNNYSSRRVSRDSILECREIVVENHIVLRIPNENLDSMVRELNKFILFLDYRIIRLDDVTFSYMLAEKNAQTLANYQKRQTQHIDTKESKLKETTNAEDALLTSKLQTDELSIQKQMIEDQLKYCTLTIDIYQKPVIIRETTPNFNYVANYKPNIFKRIGNSLIQGWWILEEIIVFLVQLWGIFLLIVVIIIAYKLIKRKMKKAA